MPITALPKPTVQAIGSTSVISDPCSIVKELLDNAIDASAASVGVEISQNTLDLVQVKDNGHGIPSADHAFVCRRTFTSKIQTLEDLRRVGGKSLGFRGQALASASEISGGVNILTRVESELVGSSMKYGRNGELLSTQRTSHPVGTTVRITDLFKHIPVRRQTALKNSAKTLTKVKKMVQTYAMCNPSKRFSFKVLKARTENFNWVYAPQHGTLIDAALKIAGYDVASNCVERQWPSEESDREGPGEAYTPGFRLVSLLPNPECDLTKINNSGQYLSIDGRPISTTRGIGQDIAKLYKSYIRTAAFRQETSATTTDPFLYLQIWCPDASYDVNIEPAKDDVLFENPHEVFALVEDLLHFTYGEKESNEKQATKGKQPARNNGSFDLLLARRDNESVSREKNDFRPAIATDTHRLVQPTPIARESSDSETNFSTNIQTPGVSKEGLNPWSLTSFNAPTQRRNGVSSNGNGPRITKYIPGRGFREWSQSSRETNRRGSATSILPSPSASSPESSCRSAVESPSQTGSFHVPRISASRTPNQPGLQKERNGSGDNTEMLDRWIGRSTESSPSQTTVGEARVPSLAQLARRRFEQSPLNERSTSPVVSTAGPSGRTRDGSISSDVRLGDRGATDWEEMRNQQERDESLTPEGWSTGLQQLSQSNGSALEDALDFERRKKEAIQKRREQFKNQPKNTNSPHLSRYLAARAALTSQPEVPDPSEDADNIRSNNGAETQTLPHSAKPALGPFDPRAYLMRRRSSSLQRASGSKVRRINTAKLPLETIPNGEEMHDVGLKQPIDMACLSGEFKNLLTTDLYTQSGCEYEAFSGSDYPELEAWTHRLRSLITKRFNAEGSDVQFDFTSLTPSI
ncbi:hypothetical protein P170DRAFT_381822 [Aspergillus steynii IBT 23096]|uniref:DNA mismatch repair protein S5 domain-containing protein n=1 Tax=Aspergillus steynii IBT 23096 TaxID=1392250 RepID=A0A2I2GD35_9EURO|nr:uncharacterized protein P170DRAFT_381822 [Aspergillus steynii IBT 23096]PLB50771.1 hypothetical protein P170DRAFT_381822 [Aspergillus steynii IBT 23096]